MDTRYIAALKREPYVKLGPCGTRAEAAGLMNGYIEKYNGENGLEPDDDGYLTPFDFGLDEVDYGRPESFIRNFDQAREFLGGKPNRDFTVSQRVSSGNSVRIEDVAGLVDDINPSHLRALDALNRLATIAQAWNRADGFAPDFGDPDQDKYSPWFAYDEESAGFVYACANCSLASANAYVGSRLCFATRERAERFGEMFQGLYNDLFL